MKYTPPHPRELSLCPTKAPVHAGGRATVWHQQREPVDPSDLMSQVQRTTRAVF